MPIATDKQFEEILDMAYAKKRALASINVTSDSTLNGVILGAQKAHSDIIVQVSTGGGLHASGSAKDMALGAIQIAETAHRLAEKTGVMIALTTDHCTPENTPAFIDVLLKHDAIRIARGEKPLWNGHMLDASARPMDDYVDKDGKPQQGILNLTRKYQKECAAQGKVLETEIGIVGGKEDGAAGEHGQHDNSKIYTTPEDMVRIYETIKEQPGRVTVAATFGNVHGMYKPGAVKLDPSILSNGQAAIAEKYGKDAHLDLVFHGGSGSELKDVHDAIDAGVIKMNVDTETQAAYTRAQRDYFQKNADKLQEFTSDNPPQPKLMDKETADPRNTTKPAIESMSNMVAEVCTRLRSNDKSMYETFRPEIEKAQQEKAAADEKLYQEFQMTTANDNNKWVARSNVRKINGPRGIAE